MATYNNLSPLHRIKKLFFSEKKDIVLLLILTLTYGLLGVATPVAVQAMVNMVTMGGVLQPLYIIGFILFFLLVLSGAIYLMETYIVELIQRRIFVHTSLEVANNAQGINIEIYDKENPVELMNRFFDISTTQKSVATLLTIGLTAFLQGVIGSIILMLYSVYFAVLVIFIIGILYFTVFYIGRHAEQSAIYESKAKYSMAEWLEGVAQSVRLYKFYNAVSRVLIQTDELANKYLEQRKKHFKSLQTQLLCAVLMYALIGTAMLILGGTLVIRGEINLGQFVAAELIIFGILAAFVRFITKLEYFYDLLAALDKLGVLQDLPQETHAGNVNSHQNTTAIHTLTVSDLEYGFNTDKPHVSIQALTLNKGESLAIVGDSGSGKTVLLELLMGLRMPESGIVQYNQLDLRLWSLNQFRDKIGIAGQVGLIKGSILQNLVLGRSHVSVEAVNEMTATLALKEEIAQLPLGLNTPLTMLGAPLSTTQLQRLELARALLGKPEMVFIDGLLDYLTESELDAVFTWLTAHQSEMMLVVATRMPRIAKRMSKQLKLGH